MNQDQPTIDSLITEMVNSKGIKARREFGQKISFVARGIQETCNEAVSKFIRIEKEVKPEFCKKCSRRSFQDVTNERFEHCKLEVFSIDEKIARIQRKDVMTLLLLARKHCETSPFHSDVFPLDLFKHILALSGVCEVIMWKDRAGRNLLKDMQFLIEQEPRSEGEQCVKNVVLKGSFLLQHMDFDYRMMPIRVDHFVKTDTLTPVYTESNGWISIRWDDAENLEWWCEFSMNSKGAVLKGRIPRDTKCLGFTNYKDRDLRWTFGSKMDSTFWADVYIFN